MSILLQLIDKYLSQISNNNRKYPDLGMNQAPGCCSAQLSMKFILLINVKMHFSIYEQDKSLALDENSNGSGHFNNNGQYKFHAQLS